MAHRSCARMAHVSELTLACSRRVLAPRVQLPRDLHSSRYCRLLEWENYQKFGSYHDNNLLSTFSHSTPLGSHRRHARSGTRLHSAGDRFPTVCPRGSRTEFEFRAAEVRNSPGQNVRQRGSRAEFRSAISCYLPREFRGTSALPHILRVGKSDFHCAESEFRGSSVGIHISEISNAKTPRVPRDFRKSRYFGKATEFTSSAARKWWRFCVRDF